MKLKLLRTRFGDELTNGQLYLDNDEFFCFTLEDPVREKDGVPVEKWKIKGQTAIPKGMYEVTLEDSRKFGPETITIHNVPGFTGIRIHAGNSPADTEGCPIIGFKLDHRGLIFPGTTRPAVNELKRRIRFVTDKVTIQII
jgi:hypothetical protein